jgi:phage tail-like protein
MTLVVATPLLRLATDELQVEAGATVETTIHVQSPSDWAAASAYDLRLRGLPSTWYSLATTRLRLMPGTTASVLLVLHPPQLERRFSVELVDGDGEAALVEARLRLIPPGATAGRSQLIEYLPRVYRRDEFLAQFLLVFQSVLDPIERRIDSSQHFLDPELTPAVFLPWLASWLDLELTPGMDEASQRAAIERAIELYRWKGTRRGLREELRLRTGTRPLIVENFDGMRLGQDAALGMNTQLGAPLEGGIVVTLVASETVDDDRVARAAEMIDELKPAHVAHVVRTVAALGQGERWPV